MAGCLRPEAMSGEDRRAMDKPSEEPSSGYARLRDRIDQAGPARMRIRNSPDRGSGLGAPALDHTIDPVAECGGGSEQHTKRDQRLNKENDTGDHGAHHDTSQVLQNPTFLSITLGYFRSTAKVPSKTSAFSK
jgi:hypothetical protein